MTQTVKFGATNGYTRKGTFKGAWQKVKRKGWTKTYPKGPKGEYSVWAAIKESMDYDEFLIDYQEAFMLKLGQQLDHWEAHPGRTKQDVLNLLRDM